MEIVARSVRAAGASSESLEWPFEDRDSIMSLGSGGGNGFQVGGTDFFQGGEKALEIGVLRAREGGAVVTHLGLGVIREKNDS